MDKDGQGTISLFWQLVELLGGDHGTNHNIIATSHFAG
jgi:hypothetical protein